MSDFAPDGFQDSASDSDAVRVLLFSDADAAGLSQISDYDKTIRVVDRVSGGDEAIERATTLLPDVILMSANSPAPSREFSHTLVKLCKSQLAERVVMMVDNPAGYFRLAVKSGAAVLLHKKATHGEVLAALRDVRASCVDPLASLLQQPSVKSRPQRLN